MAIHQCRAPRVCGERDPPSTGCRGWTYGFLAACIALPVAVAPVAAETMPAGPAFRRVGHEPNVNPALRRLTGVVLGLGRPDEKGRHYSFRLQAIGARAVAPAAGELRGWRLTILAGRRFASVFAVRDNSATEIEVEPAGETLDGLAERDVFVVEEIEPELPVLPAPTSRGPDADLPSA